MMSNSSLFFQLMALTTVVAFCNVRAAKQIIYMELDPPWQLACGKALLLEPKRELCAGGVKRSWPARQSAVRQSVS